MGEEITRKIRVYGIVQGVGFRPTVSRHAARRQIRGSVCNKGPYVEIIAQGSREAVEGFIRDVTEQPPKRAVILKTETAEAGEEVRYEDFRIIESGRTKGEIFISPDIAICDVCKEELFDPGNRRYLHPFINCTCCGPRLTILDALPYDRERTSMKEFPMCPECEEEYHNPASRRYDAQPVCCNECGPEVYLAGRKERGREALIYTRQVIRSGGIAAVKGIGGFHLCCDASSRQAVERLRRLKHRPAKPFAVMARDMDAVRRECRVTEEQEKVLTGHQKPIILLERRQEGRICPAVAPDNPRLGVMLPYAPVQLLLFDYDDGIQMPDCLVMTSGNASGAPICRDDWEAMEELADFCDCILSHNRKIRIRADDSVMDYFEGRPLMIRRSRGYAPLPCMVSDTWRGQVLAVGGELKNSFCLGINGLFYLSPYIGDLEDLRTVTALKETIGRMETLLEARPELAACDLHPLYHSSQTARELGLPVMEVQHHYAHVLSCMAENGWQGPVIGAAFDGTGYGEDKTIWGGEILWADYNSYTRMASIQPFWQTGGDASAREGWRIAVSLMAGWERDEEKVLEQAEQLGLCDRQSGRALLTMRRLKMNTVLSTSAGRLFDAVSAILGIRRCSTFEGEASMALEFAAEAWRDSGGAMPRAELPLLAEDREGRAILATENLVREIVARKLAGEDSGCLAWLFHEQLARQIGAACIRAGREKNCAAAALSGGVFQNRLLLELTADILRKAGFRVLLHSLVPPGDGGIALGQAAAAMARLNRTGNEINENAGQTADHEKTEQEERIVCV